MSSPSIRSFALDYYRKRGAEIRPLEGDEAFEICAPSGSSLTVTFANELETPAMAAVTTTSPQWRAILEDLTADVAVSYRYLAAGPIARPARTLEATMPEGWAVTSAKLLDVENRVALGFTHRVTFDSPALNACTEVIHHHLWDVAEERRLTAIEPRLYELPCIMIRPERFPEEAIVQGLLGRTLAVVDEASEVRGREIERELAGLLSEAEKRTNQYFDQQLGNVLQREVTLSEKLDATIRRLTEARTPEAIARLRQEGESLSRQLEHLKANREAEMAAVEAACAGKLDTERERHELTATTDLVALCHASYDVLTYQVEVTAPDGESARWTLRYCPVADELTYPDCPRCQSPMQTPVLLAGSDYACATCATSCDGCGTRHGADARVGQCAHCQQATCASCVTSCVDCQADACAEHAQGCGTCEAPVCVKCASRCATCDTTLCQHHARLDVRSGQTVCDRHVPIAAPPIAKVAELAAAVLGQLADDTPAAPLEVRVALAAEDADLPQLATTPAQDAAFEQLFSKPIPVFSGITGRALHPATAETCPSCNGHFAVQEMVDCATCGTPCCRPCSQGEHGPCPACEALAPVDAGDPRLAFVYEQFAELKKGRRWEVSELGPYVVAHWSRFGSWGMVVYHTAGAEPVVLNSFRCGVLDTMGQAFGGLLGAS